MKLQILCLTLLLSFPVSSFALVKSEEEFIALTIQARAIEEGLNAPLLLKIAYCESQYRINARNLNKNGTTDASIFQINSIHLPTLQKMGLDRWNYLDNINFAIHLIKRNGTRDFNSSKHCWSKPSQIALLGG